MIKVSVPEEELFGQNILSIVNLSTIPIPQYYYAEFQNTILETKIWLLKVQGSDLEGLSLKKLEDDNRL